MKQLSKLIFTSLCLSSFLLGSCGNSETPTHHYSSEWSHNGTSHWHECIDEGYEDLKKDEANHTFVDVVTPPTYEAGGYTTHTCSICNYSYVDSKTEKLVHHYSSEWSKNETNHWHACTDEGYEDLKKDEASHVYDDDHDAICNTCGYERSLGDHTPSDEWDVDYQHHWHACTHAGCELKFDYEEHDCTPAGYCETCDEVVSINNIRLDYTFTERRDENFGTLEPGTYYYDISFADPEATYRMALSHKTYCYVSNESGSFDDPIEIGTDGDDTYILPKPFNQMIYFKIVIEDAHEYRIYIWQFK